MKPDTEPTATRQATGGRPWIAHWNFSSIEIALLLLTAGLAFMAEQFSLPFLTDPALLCAGLLFAVLGAEQIVARLGVYRAGGWSYAQAVETYKAVVAQLWGLIFMGVGVIMITRTLLKWFLPDMADSLWNGLVSSSAAVGLALAGVGLMTTLHGLIRTLAGSAGTEVGGVRGLSDFLDRSAGAATLLFGLVMSLAGFVVLLAPDFVNNLIAQLGTMITGP